MKTKSSLAGAQFIASEIIKTLSPLCHNIEVAGSVRRECPQVGDIEIIALPRMIYSTDLFGARYMTEASELDAFDWSILGKFVKGGHKYKQIDLYLGMTLDLFIVTPPAQYGVIKLIRTGPDSFSRKFVTHKFKGGLLPGHLEIKDGAIYKLGALLPTREESDVFELLGISYISPEKRS